MISVRTVHGWRRALFLAQLKWTMARSFLPLLWTDNLSLRRFVQFLRRLNFFLSKLGHNKFVRIGRVTRLDLYVPSFPSPALRAGCRKFLAFDGDLPCMTVLVSLTSACRFSCPHCYQQHDRGHDAPIGLLVDLVRRLQARGVAFFNLEGGEPFLVYDRLKQVCAAIDRRAEVWVNSTGDGMTAERLRELKGLNLTAVMFSLHTADPARLNAFMHSERAWDTLRHGVDLCHEAEIPVAFNACVTRDGFRDGEFERIMDQARAFHACLLQLVHPKPAGAWLETGVSPFDVSDMDHVRRLVRRYNHDPAFASYPPIAAQILEEDEQHFGCTAGGTDRFYVNAKGDVQPCEFLNLSFGNLADEDFDVIYGRMRQAFQPPRDRWMCEACAPRIRELVHQYRLTSLPLNRDLTEQVSRDWDRGAPTAVYAKLQRMR